MISAGKVPATTIERSRTTKGCRGSDRTASARSTPGAPRSHRGPTRRRRPDPAAAARARRRPPGAADRRRRSAARRRREPPPPGPRPEKARAPVRTATGTPSASQSRSTTPFRSKKSTSTRPTGPVHRRRRSGPGDADGSGFAVGREARPDLEQPDVLAVRAGGCARRRRPVPVSATAGACRTWPTTDWRAAIGSSRRRPWRTRRAAFASMNPNVTASDSPAAVRTRRTSRSRGMRGSGGGAGAVTTGKVAGSLSNP